MGMFWTYHTYDEAKWNSIFGSRNEPFVPDLVSSMIWDKDVINFDDAPDANTERAAYLAFVMKHAPADSVSRAEAYVRDGVIYTSHPPQECVRVDNDVRGFFKQEGIAHLLDVRQVGNEFVSMKVTHELLARGLAPRGGLFGLGKRPPPIVQTKLAHILVEGRRYGTSDPCARVEPYFMVTASEPALLLAEVDALMTTNAPWSSDEFREAASRDVRSALFAAVETNRPLFGNWG